MLLLLSYHTCSSYWWYHFNFELEQGKFAQSSGRDLDAGTLITLNKDFIAEEALILAKQWDPSTTVPDDTKCKRDIKLLLDGVVTRP